MIKKSRYIIKNRRLNKYLIEKNIIQEIGNIKYKTEEKNMEYVDYLGWKGIYLYANGIYKLNNGLIINFDYCYEMDINNWKNIKKVIYYHIKTNNN